MDDLEVIGCVAAIISTYDEGLKALETIREQWSAGEHAPDHEIDRVVEQLKDCIKLDATAILESYDNNYKQSGRPFAGGDRKSPSRALLSAICAFLCNCKEVPKVDVSRHAHSVYPRIHVHCPMPCTLTHSGPTSASNESNS